MKKINGVGLTKDGIDLYSKDDFLGMHKAGRLAAQILDEIGEFVYPGQSTAKIDRIIEDKGEYSWFRKGPTAEDFFHDEVTPHFFSKAFSYIKEKVNKEEPFFLYLPLPSPHTPILPTEKWLGKSGLNEYADFVMQTDDVVGQIVDAVDTNDLTKKTIVIFTSDNGCSKAANIDELATAVIRGAFEFQGQKCSAASRIYIPKSISKVFYEKLKSEISKIKMGSPEDFKNFMTAVIHENSFDKLTGVIEKVKSDKDAEILIGGGYDKSKGYFIEPTVIKTSNAKYYSMETELFGPLVTIYEYDDKDWNKTLKLVDETSEYALTGAIFCDDRYILSEAVDILKNCAGNFYINDKCTGAVVGQQPFGGARGSGTNDKAGSYLNLLRWVSPRLIKEVFVPPKDFKYPFMG